MSAQSPRDTLIGWKAIAAYCRRNRSTVIRWHEERGLPVHVIPGGKQRTVFAYTTEISDWLHRQEQGIAADEAGADDVIPVPDAAGPQSVNAPPQNKDEAPANNEAPPQSHPALGVLHYVNKHRKIIAAAGIALAMSACAYVATVNILDHKRERHGLPSNPVARSQYLEARDAWGQRTAESIQKSIRLYQEVIAAEPDFAPARVGLAESWLILREYGNVPDARAFEAAKIAANRAVELSPNLASGHRALGFIHYWWDNDPTKALSEFERALQLDGNNAQTHFWFANALADMGKDKAAEFHYAKARQLDPGSRPIEIEYACAQWQAGRDQIALARLLDLTQRYPKDATIYNCLTWVYIGLGDIRNASAAYTQLASLRQEPTLVRFSADLAKAVEQDAATAHKILIDKNLKELQDGTRRIRLEPAFYASAMNDRQSMVALMHDAIMLGEKWYSPPVTRRMEAKWKSDAAVTAMLDKLVSEPDVNVTHE